VSRRVADLIECLRRNPNVVGLVRYGRRRVQDDSPGGDFDLFAFLDVGFPDLEGIHFYWASTPVDLSLRTLGDLERETPLSYIDRRLPDGEILLDRTGSLSEDLSAAAARWGDHPGPMPESEATITRFYQSHVLDKVRGRLATDPIFCEMLLSTNITWLLHILFKVEQDPFPGERGALEWVRKHRPDIAERIACFFGSRGLERRLQLSEELTELILEPIGGVWRRGEVLGTSEDPSATGLAEQAHRAFVSLTGTTPEKAAS